MKKHLFQSAILFGFFFSLLVNDILAIPPSGNMKVLLEKNSFRYPEPVLIQVYLYGPNPIMGARVAATITSPAGKKETVIFSEDAVFGAMIPRSGGYAGAISELNEDGEYRIHVHADDNDGKAYSGGGFVQDLPNPLPADHLPAATPAEPFQFTHDTVVHLSGYAGRENLPPLKISTLYATVDRKKCVHISWTVPPNIVGGGQYEIRLSARDITSDRAWQDARRICRANYTHKGGETQQQKLCNLGKGTFCIAVRSWGGGGPQSDLSNSYRVVIP